MVRKKQYECIQAEVFNCTLALSFTKLLTNSSYSTEGLVNDMHRKTLHRARTSEFQLNII